jgi:DNA-directed RNA polymerase subunit M/transcription elongation factor TFIIS
MSEQTPGKRACPKCGSDNYTFRGRKQIEATEESGPMLETRYACRACEHAWKESVAGVLQKAPPRE